MTNIYFDLPECIQEIIDMDLDKHVFNTVHKPVQDYCMYRLGFLCINTSSILRYYIGEKKDAETQFTERITKHMIRAIYLQRPLPRW